MCVFAIMYVCETHACLESAEARTMSRTEVSPLQNKYFQLLSNLSIPYLILFSNLKFESLYIASN